MARPGVDGVLIHPTGEYLASFRALLLDLAIHGQQRVDDPDFDISDLELLHHIESIDTDNYWWIVDDEVIGRIRLRTTTNNDFYASHGDVGYDISPKYQNQGQATKMLEALLKIAHHRGREHLLITCRKENLASKRVLEKNGGKVRDLYEGEFWRFDFELN